MISLRAHDLEAIYIANAEHRASSEAFLASIETSAAITNARVTGLAFMKQANDAGIEEDEKGGTKFVLVRYDR
jgi:hypothetical protein